MSAMSCLHRPAWRLRSSISIMPCRFPIRPCRRRRTTLTPHHATTPAMKPSLRRCRRHHSLRPQRMRLPIRSVLRHLFPHACQPRQALRPCLRSRRRLRHASRRSRRSKRSPHRPRSLSRSRQHPCPPPRSRQSRWRPLPLQDGSILLRLPDRSERPTARRRVRGSIPPRSDQRSDKRFPRASPASPFANGQTLPR